MAANDILVDLECCTGCWTCAFSCKIGHGLADDDWRVISRTLGSGEGIDKPAGTWGDLHMEWMPVWVTKCMRCGPNKCTESYPEPFCVHNCPTGALSFGDLDDPESAACDWGFENGILGLGWTDPAERIDAYGAVTPEALRRVFSAVCVPSCATLCALGSPRRVKPEALRRILLELE